MICAYLSIALLVGLLANAVLGWWWADPAAALVMVLSRCVRASRRGAATRAVTHAEALFLAGWQSQSGPHGQSGSQSHRSHLIRGRQGRDGPTSPFRTPRPFATRTRTP
jgi:hypothetical protein